MALHVPRAGYSAMLKDGAKHMSGIDESVFRNIEACKDLYQLTKTSFGPIGMHKIIVNHLEKLFVTKDATTMLNELEIQHPAAKILVLAAQQMEREAGDGTNAVIMIAGNLLEHAEELIRSGLTQTEIVEGYDKAAKRVLEVLPNLSVFTVDNIRDTDNVFKALRSCLASKNFASQDFLAGIVSKACISILPENPKNFNVEYVRVIKIPGAGIDNSFVVNGVVHNRSPSGDVTEVTDAKIAIYSCPFDIMATETKGTVLIKTSQELSSFSRGEEELIEQLIKNLADDGVNLVVSGGKIGDLCLHYLNKYKIMCFNLSSKFDILRLSQATGASILAFVAPPNEEETGSCSRVYITEIGDTNVIILEQVERKCKISTIVLRGSTPNYMDEVERAINDGVNNFKALTKDGRLLAGAGAVEIELSRKLASFGDTCPGLDQYAIKKFAESLEYLPRTLADNAGFKGHEILSKLFVAHQKGQIHKGIDVINGDVIDSVDDKVFDLFLIKEYAIKLANTAATTVLRIDQIIMAKPAGGPKPQENKSWDED